jgi:hypothetical protein
MSDAKQQLMDQVRQQAAIQNARALVDVRQEVQHEREMGKGDQS